MITSDEDPASEMERLRTELALIRPVFAAACEYADHEHLHIRQWPLDLYRQQLLDATAAARARLPSSTTKT